MQRRIVCGYLGGRLSGETMSDTRTILGTLRRPPLLMRAVRAGLAHYRRGPALRRLAGGETLPARALTRLLAHEARMEETRASGGAGYSPARHVELLVALVAEARLLDKVVALR